MCGNVNESLQTLLMNNAEAGRPAAAPDTLQDP